MVCIIKQMEQLFLVRVVCITKQMVSVSRPVLSVWLHVSYVGSVIRVILAFRCWCVIHLLMDPVYGDFA
jgi:hypothetical protein